MMSYNVLQRVNSHYFRIAWSPCSLIPWVPTTFAMFVPFRTAELPGTTILTIGDDRWKIIAPCQQSMAWRLTERVSQQPTLCFNDTSKLFFHKPWIPIKEDEKRNPNCHHLSRPETTFSFFSCGRFFINTSAPLTIYQQAIYTRIDTHPPCPFLRKIHSDPFSSFSKRTMWVGPRKLSLSALKLSALGDFQYRPLRSRTSYHHPHTFFLPHSHWFSSPKTKKLSPRTPGRGIEPRAPEDCQHHLHDLLIINYVKCCNESLKCYRYTNRDFTHLLQSVFWLLDAELLRKRVVVENI